MRELDAEEMIKIMNWLWKEGYDHDSYTSAYVAKMDKWLLYKEVNG